MLLAIKTVTGLARVLNVCSPYQRGCIIQVLQRNYTLSGYANTDNTSHDHAAAIIA